MEFSSSIAVLVVVAGYGGQLHVLGTYCAMIQLTPCLESGTHIYVGLIDAWRETREWV